MMLSVFTKVKSAKAETTVKLFTFVTTGSEVPAPRTCPETDYFQTPSARSRVGKRGGSSAPCGDGAQRQSLLGQC